MQWSRERPVRCPCQEDHAQPDSRARQRLAGRVRVSIWRPQPPVNSSSDTDGAEVSIISGRVARTPAKYLIRAWKLPAPGRACRSPRGGVDGRDALQVLLQVRPLPGVPPERRAERSAAGAVGWLAQALRVPVEHGHIVCDGCTVGRTVSERDRERFNRPCENRIRIEEPRARGEPAQDGRSGDEQGDPFRDP